jgi:uncharacterized repeat protein (TIGR01451 family)
MKNLLVIPTVLALALAGPACADIRTVDESTAPLTLSSSSPGIVVTVSSTGPLIQGLSDTYTWTATNVSNGAIAGVGLGSNWVDADGKAPIVKTLAPGCGTQSPNDLPPGAALGIWCGALTGVTLAPGASVSGWATIQDTAVGPVRYNLYAIHTDPISGGTVFTVVSDTESAGPGPTDLQITGSSNNGSPPLGGAFAYTFQVKNNGPWATAGGVAFADALPASLGFVSVTTTQGACAGGQTVACALGDLAVGGQATISITVRAPDTAQAITDVASASLTAPQDDPKSANDSVSVSVASK